MSVLQGCYGYIFTPLNNITHLALNEKSKTGITGVGC